MLLNGHDTFQISNNLIDPDVLVASLKLGDGNFGRFAAELLLKQKHEKASGAAEAMNKKQAGL